MEVYNKYCTTKEEDSPQAFFFGEASTRTTNIFSVLVCRQTRNETSPFDDDASPEAMGCCVVHVDGSYLASSESIPVYPDLSEAIPAYAAARVEYLKRRICILTGIITGKYFTRECKVLNIHSRYFTRECKVLNIHSYFDRDHSGKVILHGNLKF